MRIVSVGMKYVQRISGSEKFFIVLALLAVFLLPSCAQMGFLKPEDPAYAEAKKVWERYLQRAEEQSGNYQAFWLKGNLIYTSSGRTSRVSVEMWGDNDLPARLDVSTPMGVALLICREDSSGFLAFAPDREEAWKFSGAADGLSALGMASAFSLPIIAKMTFGQLDGSLVPASFESARVVKGKGFEYYFNQSRTASLLVDDNGRPLKITGRPGDKFMVAFDNFIVDEDLEMPSKIIFEGRKNSAELTVKDRELRQERWVERSLKMVIPDWITVKQIK